MMCRAFVVLMGTACLAATTPALAQAVPPPATAQQPAAPAPAPTLPPGVTAPTGYLIGSDDVLSIVFWRDKDMSADVNVRPDGMISLPLINDVAAAGLTPEQLRVAITQAAAKYVEDPTVTVVVKQINSRRVYITGQVSKPGPYALLTPTTVLQLIAIAGGVAEYADIKNITIMRTENGQPKSFVFNYEEVKKRKKLEQNIELRPGDTVIVP